jgi:hypothetical protein
MNQVVTPAQIEARLYALSKEVDDCHSDLVEAEADYHRVKSQYELAMAQQRIYFAQHTAPNGKNYTVQERDDHALLQNQGLHIDMGVVEARVKASRANSQRIKTQVEIARSIGTSVRTSLDLA